MVGDGEEGDVLGVEVVEVVGEVVGGFVVEVVDVVEVEVGGTLVVVLDVVVVVLELDVEVEVEVGGVLVDVVVAGGGPALLVPFREPTYALKLYFSQVLAIFKLPYPLNIALPFLVTWKY